MPIQCDGYPDVCSSNSLVQVFNFQSTITKPAALPSAGTWDCHIFANPVSPPLVYSNLGGGGTGPDGVDVRLYQCQLNNQGGYQNQVPNNWLVGGVNAITIASGGNWLTGAGTNRTDLALPVKACSGAWRVIGMAFEVVNTTASLYKGGTIINYKSPAYRSTTISQGFDDTLTAGQRYVTDYVSLPPVTSQDAALYPTSRTWGAEEGTYIVCALNDQEVSYNRPLSAKQAGCIRDLDVNALTTGIPFRRCYLPNFKTSGAQNWSSANNNALPFDISGCVLTGLNENSTLSVTARYVLERIPTVAEPDLLVLTRPPASYDPMAMELYSKVMSELPVAVRVADNPAGEWWNTVLDGIEAALPAVGTALAGLTGGMSIPVSGAAMLGVKGIRNAINTSPSGIAVARAPPRRQRKRKQDSTLRRAEKALNEEKKALKTLMAKNPFEAKQGKRKRNKKRRVTIIKTV